VEYLSSLAAAVVRLGLMGNGPPPLLAIGWGTVDRERSAAEAAGLSFEPAPDEAALGARALIARPGSVDLVLLEPSTEGKLAAALARRGEGITAIYVGVRRVGGITSPTALGRPGRLLPHGRPWGPFVILVATSAPDE
jgi:hypothetical protein